MATQPATPAAPGVSRMIRQLDDPSYQRRQEAVKTLTDLGPDILPELQSAGETASFETRAMLEQIARPARLAADRRYHATRPAS